MEEPRKILISKWVKIDFYLLKFLDDFPMKLKVNFEKCMKQNEENDKTTRRKNRQRSEKCKSDRLKARLWKMEIDAEVKPT